MEASHQAFEVGVEIWASRRQQGGFGCGARLQEFAKWRELGVAVHQHMRGISQEPLLRISQLACHWSDPSTIGIGGDVADFDMACRMKVIADHSFPIAKSLE